jgi:hypothetical protein
MLLSCPHNAEQNHDIKTANRSFENVALTFGKESKKSLIQEEIKKRLNSSNACYHFVQKLLHFPLLPKNVKIRIYKTIILPVLLCGCETWSHIKGGTQGF